MAHSADASPFAIVYSQMWDKITETTAAVFAKAEEVSKELDGPSAAQAVGTAALGIYDALPSMYTHKLVQSANQGGAADAWRADAAAGLGHHGRRQLLSHDAPPPSRPEGAPAAQPWRPAVPEDDAPPLWDALDHMGRMALTVAHGIYGTAAGARTAAPTQPRGRPMSGAVPVREVGGGEMARAVGQGAAVLMSELSDLARDPDARDGPSETPDVLSPGGEAVLRVLGRSADLLSAAASLGVQVDLVGIIGDATAGTVEKTMATAAEGGATAMDAARYFGEAAYAAAKSPALSEFARVDPAAWAANIAEGHGYHGRRINIQ